MSTRISLRGKSTDSIKPIMSAPDSSQRQGRLTKLPVQIAALATFVAAIAGLLFMRSELMRIQDEKLAAEIRFKDLAASHLKVLEQRVADFELDPKEARSRITEANHFANGAGLSSNFESPESLLTGPQANEDFAAGFSMNVISHSSSECFKHIDLALKFPDSAIEHSLRREDLEVFVGDKRVSAVTVSKTHLSVEPHAIAILRDKSASTKGEPDIAAGEAIRGLVNSLANPSRLKLWNFSDATTPITPWTNDRQLLASLVLEQEPTGGTALYKSILVAINDIASRKERRSIVLFTDGKDSLNHEGVENVIATANRSSVRIIVVALKTLELQEAILKRLASETNGSYLLAENPKAISSHFKKVALSFQQPVCRIIALHAPQVARTVRVKLGASEVSIMD